MIFLIIVGGVIVVALGLAAWYDHRAKRHGWRVNPSSRGAIGHSMDWESTTDPKVQGDQNNAVWGQPFKK